MTQERAPAGPGSDGVGRDEGQRAGEPHAPYSRETESATTTLPLDFGDEARAYALTIGIAGVLGVALGKVNELVVHLRRAGRHSEANRVQSLGERQRLIAAQVTGLARLLAEDSR